MNKKLIFRILGALASALIIVSVFVPFVSVTGHSSSLWQSSEITKSLYLPITLICFGVIGVVFFALNIKTEFAYMSTGAITFFLIVQTIEVLNQGIELFKTLGVGYYFLVIGAILTGIMAFLLNLKSKEVQKSLTNQETEVASTTSILSQIDKLYDNTLDSQNNVAPIQAVDPIVQPLSAQPEMQPIQPIAAQPEVQPIQPVAPQPEVQTIQPVAPQPEVQPIQPIATQPEQIIEPISPVDPIPSGGTPTENPVLAQFAQSSSQPATLDNSNFATQEPQAINNPVIQTFMDTPASTSSQTDVTVESSLPIEVNQGTGTFMSPESLQTSQTNEKVEQLLSSQSNSVSSEVDIFGQPINK